MILRNLPVRIALLGVVGALVSCGGVSGANSPGNTIGPTAILNGPTVPTANSSWVASDCGVKVELTRDGGFVFAVTDTSGTTSGAQTTWSASGSSGASIVPVSGPDGLAWVSTLANISGSTSSRSFSAGVTVVVIGFDTQYLGTCSFSLQPTTLPVG